MLCKLSGRFFLYIFLIANNKSWPPSTIGIGRRFNIPRLIEIRARKVKNIRMPLSAAVVQVLMIPIGPEKFLK